MIITMEAGQLQWCRVQVWSGLVWSGMSRLQCNQYIIQCCSTLDSRHSMCGEEIRRSFFAVRIGTNARLEAKSFWIWNVRLHGTLLHVHNMYNVVVHVLWTLRSLWTMDTHYHYHALRPSSLSILATATTRKCLWWCWTFQYHTFCLSVNMYPKVYSNPYAFSMGLYVLFDYYLHRSTPNNSHDQRPTSLYQVLNTLWLSIATRTCKSLQCNSVGFR